MKLIASGVISSAAMVRSPSFSRSSSSTTTTILPARKSSRASGIVAKDIYFRITETPLKAESFVQVGGDFGELLRIVNEVADAVSGVALVKHFDGGERERV